MIFNRREFAHLGHIDDDVAGGVDDEHEVVPAGEVISPGRPVEKFTVLNHLARNFQVGHDFVNVDVHINLYCFIDIEDKFA